MPGAVLPSVSHVNLQKYVLMLKHVHFVEYTLLRTLYILGALMAYAIAGNVTYVKWLAPSYTAQTDDASSTGQPTLWFIMLVVTSLAAAITLTCMACSQNIYRLKSGTGTGR
jgi:hypothetical protein